MKYESLATCPDDLLLFMYYVPYTYRLHSHEAVMQYIDDSHYWGAEAAAAQVTAWESIRGKVSDAIYAEVLKRLQFQAGHAIVWRDAITEWFTKMSSIPDAKNRVGHYPRRIEAESMQFDGYTPTDVTPWETASHGRAVICQFQMCSVQTTWDNPDGWYDVTVQYFDLLHGKSSFALSVAGKEVDHWVADDTLPSDKLNGHTSTRRVVHGAEVHRGDLIRVTGWPDRAELAPLGYVEIVPSQAHKAPQGVPRGVRSPI